MLLAIDTETALATDAEPVPRLVSVAMAVEGGSRLWAAHESTIERALDEAFRHTTVFANAPFDVFAILKAFPSLWPVILQAYEDGRIKDVLTREKLIDIAEGEHRKRGKYSLAAAAERRAGITLDKSADTYRLRYAELLGLEISQWPAAAVEYAIKDATTTLAVYRAQEEISAEVFADEARQARAHLALYAQTLRGIRTDARAVEELDRQISALMEERRAQLLATGLARMVGGGPRAKKPARFTLDTKAAMAMVDATPGPKRYTKRGAGISSDDLGKLNLPPGHPLRSYQEFGSLQSLRTKNIAPFRHPIVRCRYEELVSSGRTSASKPGEPWHGTNLQNLPRPDTLRRMGITGGFRECLIPPPGHVFVISDFSGAELVTLAQVQLDVLGRSTLADVLREDRNPHDELGALILGVDKIDKSIPEHKDARQLAKVPNFGYPGGLGAARFVDFARTQYGVILTEDRARELKELWLQQWPEMRDYFAWIASMQDFEGKIVMVQPRSLRIRGGCGYTDACNTPYQGLAADAAKTALWWLFRASLEPSSPLFGCYQCLFVHDENVTVVPRDRAASALAEQERIMIAAFAQWCPDVPIKVESVISERYCK